MGAEGSPRRLLVNSGTLRLPAVLYLPGAPPAGALLVCHGAGSRKENHLVMARQAASRGLAGMVFDFRGHGDAPGVMDAAAGDDVRAAAELLRRVSRAPWVAARGSSMGAYWLLRTAAADPDLFRGVAALCPADEASLLRGLDRFAAPGHTDDQSSGGRFDVPDLREALRTSDLVRACAGLPNVLLAHARDDQDVPFSVSEHLAAVLAPPSRLIALPRGGHHGPQRSPLVARATLDWALRPG